MWRISPSLQMEDPSNQVHLCSNLAHPYWLQWHSWMHQGTMMCMIPAISWIQTSHNLAKVIFSEISIRKMKDSLSQAWFFFLDVNKTHAQQAEHKYLWTSLLHPSTWLKCFAVLSLFCLMLLYAVYETICADCTVNLRPLCLQHAILLDTILCLSVKLFV